jgi:hypothetical protein
MGELQLVDKQTSIMERGTLSSSAVLAHVAKIQGLMKELLHEGEHYGVIPGTEKKSLLKAGAEKLSFTFRLLPKFRIAPRDLPNNHREYDIVCELWHESGVFAGEGVGSCSTMESKYRYRNIADFEDTGDSIPADSKEKKAEYRKQGFGMKKINGQWAWVKYKDSARTENPDIADVYNTVLKMAKKRALVDATITACAASDIFTQDVADPEEDSEPRDVTPAPVLIGDIAKRKELEEEIGRLSKIIGADAIAIAHDRLADHRDLVKSGGITMAEYMTWLTTFKGELEGMTAGDGGA